METTTEGRTMTELAVVPDIPETPTLPASSGQIPAMIGPPDPGEWEIMLTVCDRLAKSMLVPKDLRGKPSDILVVALTARELRLGMMTALAKINVIEGKPSMSAELMTALIQRDGHMLTPARLDEHGAVIRYRRRDWPEGEWGEFEFSRRDAIQAGLLDLWFERWYQDSSGKNRKEVWAVPGGADLGPENIVDQILEELHAPEWVLKQGASQVKRKDNWWNYPKSMFWARCLPARAQALTRDGWVDKSKVCEGSEILAFDKTIGRTRWAKVTAVHEFEAQQTYAMHSRSFSCVATADHRWVTDTFHAPGKWVMRRTDQLHDQKIRMLVSAPVVDEPSEIDPADAARIGWVLTDGSILWRGNSPTVTISQTKHLDAVRDLFGFATETVIPPREHEAWGRLIRAKAEHRWRLSAAQGRELLATFDVVDKTQVLDHIPPALDEAGRQAMFEAMNLANGTTRSGSEWLFRSGYESVLSCYMTLATLLGYRLGPVRKFGNCWEVSASQARPRLNPEKVSVTPLTVEPVWCPTTECDTWVARIDGQITITGNCISQVGRMAFADVLMGVSYTPEEMGFEVDPATGEPLDNLAPQEQRDDLIARARSLPPSLGAELRAWAQDVQAPPLNRCPLRWVAAWESAIEQRESFVVDASTDDTPTKPEPASEEQGATSAPEPEPAPEPPTDVAPAAPVDAPVPAEVPEVVAPADVPPTLPLDTTDGRYPEGLRLAWMMPVEAIARLDKDELVGWCDVLGIPSVGSNADRAQRILDAKPF